MWFILKMITIKKLSYKKFYKEKMLILRVPPLLLIGKLFSLPDFRTDLSFRIIDSFVYGDGVSVYNIFGLSLCCVGLLYIIFSLSCEAARVKRAILTYQYKTHFVLTSVSGFKYLPLISCKPAAVSRGWEVWQIVRVGVVCWGIGLLFFSRGNYFFSQRKFASKARNQFDLILDNENMAAWRASRVSGRNLAFESLSYWDHREWLYKNGAQNIPLGFLHELRSRENHRHFFRSREDLLIGLCTTIGVNQIYVIKIICFFLWGRKCYKFYIHIKQYIKI